MRCAITGGFLIDAINPWVYTRNRLRSPTRHTQNKTKKIYILRNPSVMLNFSFFLQPISMEYLAISGRMAPGWAGTAKQKRAYCSWREKANDIRFYVFCTTSDPRSGHWPRNDENREILFGGPHQNVLQLVTTENKYGFSLANLMVFFIVTPVNYAGQ